MAVGSLEIIGADAEDILFAYFGTYFQSIRAPDYRVWGDSWIRRFISWNPNPDYYLYLYIKAP